MAFSPREGKLYLMLKTIFIFLVSFLFRANSCFAAPEPALEAAGQLGFVTADISTEAIPAPARVGSDLTADYTRLRNTPGQGLGEKEITELRKCKVLLVRGFLTGGYVEPFEIFGKKIWIGRYFNDQMEELKALGVDFTMADIDSVMLPEHNAAKLAKEIRSSEKPVILISHSDGGMYVLQALIENPDLAPKVRGFISLQTPFRGSPVADYVKGNKTFSSAMKRLLGHFGGTIESLESLTPLKREGYQDSNRGAIGGVVSGLNMISFASWKPEKHMKFDTLLELPRDFMLKRGLDNDGLVPVESAILPGSDYIKLEGVDHTVPVMSADMILKFDRRSFTRTLLSMIISR